MFFVLVLTNSAVPATARAAVSPTTPSPAPSGGNATTAPGNATAHVNTAVTPVPRDPNWVQRHQGFVTLAKKGGIDVLFLGDSITDFWRNAGRPGVDNPPQAGKVVFAQNYGNLKTANFGISGDRTQHVLWRLQNGEGAGFQPKVIVLLIGTNNTGLENDGSIRNTSPEAVAGVTAVVQDLRQRFADAKILLLAIFPRGDKGTGPRNQVAEVNQAIAKLNDGQHVYYLDIGDRFLDANGAIPADVMADKLHPTQKGYAIWAAAMKPTLDQLLKASGLPASGPATAP